MSELEDTPSVSQPSKREWVTPQHIRVDHQYTEGGIQMSVTEGGHDTAFGGSPMVVSGTVAPIS